MPNQASVIIRAKDKADTIGLTLRALRGQTRAVEIVVVDSGSTDGTLEIARRWADRVVEIPAESFSYGRALNIGAAVSSGSVHFALSAHCVPKRADWVEHSLSLYDDDRIAATNQARVTPRGEPILDRYIQTRDDALRHPGWGFSNHAASWRADVWAALPFREDLPACEDKEWSWRVLAAGWGIAYCPAPRGAVHSSAEAGHQGAAPSGGAGSAGDGVPGGRPTVDRLGGGAPGVVPLLPDEPLPQRPETAEPLPRRAAQRRCGGWSTRGLRCSCSRRRPVRRRAGRWAARALRLQPLVVVRLHGD